MWNCLACFVTFGRMFCLIGSCFLNRIFPEDYVEVILIQEWNIYVKLKFWTVVCSIQVSYRQSVLLPHRGGLHAAPVLGAAAVGGSTSAGVSALPGSERVASQRGSLPQSHPLLQQGQGRTRAHTKMHTQNILPALFDIFKTFQLRFIHSMQKGNDWLDWAPQTNPMV